MAHTNSQQKSVEHSASTLDLHRALTKAVETLLAERSQRGHWEGELSASALSTATAVTALAIWNREIVAEQIDIDSREKLFGKVAIENRRHSISNGLRWLVSHQNNDGGWGDTTKSFSNISTTALGWAAFGAVPGADEDFPDTVANAREWLRRKAGGTSPHKLSAAITARYGKDKTFSVPILTMCALAGRLGPDDEAWLHVQQLPFELAAFPQELFAALRLPVVSYALPALIAIGQVRHAKRPTRNPLTRTIRHLTRARTLDVLGKIQPESGGFLEATPLTSFVTMSLAGAGNAHRPVTLKAVEFLLASIRADGSWPIDTNLATWVTTLSINALAEGRGQVPSRNSRCEEAQSFIGEGGQSLLTSAATANGSKIANEELSGGPPHPGPLPQGEGGVRGTAAYTTNSISTLSEPGFYFSLSDSDRQKLCDWLLDQHYQTTHPYTNAAPGGWAWTDLSGGVPDADDTPGALLALKNLGIRNERVQHAVKMGIRWLLEIQNADGGIPTFCRGWTNLPFDRSSPDLTAHALRAWNAWLPETNGAPSTRSAFGNEAPAEGAEQVLGAPRIIAGIEAGLNYLHATQRADGAWLPLWFGNQHSIDDENPTYGTARVLMALNDLSSRHSPIIRQMTTRATEWLCNAQKPDGSWGGGNKGPASIEESALALEALAGVKGNDAAVKRATTMGAKWLIEQVNNGKWIEPSAIGFYFAKLWYFEKLYPMIFTVGALTKCRNIT